jgi:hypothetical protein
MNEIRTLLCLVASGFCAKFAYGCYQSWKQAEIGSALANGLAGIFGQNTNLDLGVDARNEFIFWSFATLVCLWLAFKKSKKE